MVPSVDKDWKSLFDEGNLILGEISTEWGKIDWALFLIFEELLGVDQSVAWPVFFSQRNNRSRLDMLLALSNSKWATDSRLVMLHKLIERARKAAGRRNSVEHGQWRQVETSGPGGHKFLLRISGTTYQGEHHLALTNDRRLGQAGLDKYRHDFKKIRAIKSQLSRLVSDLEDFWRHLAFGEKYPKQHSS